jgi:hypothetical protein
MQNSKVEFSDNKVNKLRRSLNKKEIQIIAKPLIESISKVDEYRSIIKEKLKIENSFSKELVKITQQIFSKKKEKKILQRTNREVYDYTKKIKDELNSVDNKNSNIYFIRDSHLKKYQRIYDEKSKQISKLEEDIKYLKFLSTNMQNDQRTYYYEILKNGFDVRNDGLIWVIKKLLELNAVLDLSKFPFFLNHSQINYLLRISYKTYELSQMKLILFFWKSKAKRLHDKNDLDSRETKSTINNFMNTFYSYKDMELTNATILTDSYYNIYSDRKNVESVSITKKNLDLFENIAKNSTGVMKCAYEFKFEEASINRIVEKLKRKMKLLEHDEIYCDVRKK